MKTLRNTLAVAVAAATLGIAAISASSPADAYGFRHGGGFHRPGHFGHGHWGHRFGHHWGHRWGGGHRWGYRWGGHRWGYRWGGGHRFGYRWGGYRRFVGASYGVVSAPSACPPGTHLGYNAKYCWPNRY